MDPTSSTPAPVTPEIAALLARLEESDRRARLAEIELNLSKMRIVQLEERLRLLRIAKYGPRGESLSAAQLALFEEEISATLDEVAAEAARGPLAEAPAKPRKRRKAHPGRQTLPADLPRVVNVVACAPAQCTCGNCGTETAVIGYEESERLDVEPAKFFVTVTRREKRACRNCKQGGVATAPVGSGGSAWVRWVSRPALRREMRQSSSGTVAVRRKLVGKRAVVVEDGRSSGSGGRLCWRATCQGIHCWKLILMSHSESGVPLSGALRLAASG